MRSVRHSVGRTCQVARLHGRLMHWSLRSLMPDMPYLQFSEASRLAK